MESDLRCNFRKCMQPLMETAYVTSCSHVFCEEDGKREFARHMVCPACGENLSGQGSVMHILMDPQEQYKSMVLAGQRPDVVLDIASRAINFYCYQLLQGKLYQEVLAQKLADKCAENERKHNQFVLQSQGEVADLTEKLNRLMTENNELAKKQRDLTDSLNAKCKDNAKLRAFCECLRRRQLDPRLGRETTESVNQMLTTNRLNPSAASNNAGGLANISGAIVDGKSIAGMNFNSPSFSGRFLNESRPLLKSGGGVGLGIAGQRLVQRFQPGHIATNQQRPNFLQQDVTRDRLNCARIQVPKSPLVREPHRKLNGKTPNLKNGHGTGDTFQF